MGTCSYGNIRAYIVNYLFSFYQSTHGYPYDDTNMGQEYFQKLL